MPEDKIIEKEPDNRLRDLMAKVEKIIEENRELREENHYLNEQLNYARYLDSLK